MTAIDQTFRSGPIETISVAGTGTRRGASPTASAAGLPSVTLALPTRDRPEMARSALASVLEGDIVPDEIVVVDQGNEPMSATAYDDVVTTTGCRIRVERSLPGLSRAVNHAARVGAHDVFVVIHDDVLVARDWLRTLVSALAAHGAGAVVTGRVAAGQPERAGAFAPALRDDAEPAVYRGRAHRCAIRPMNIALWRNDHLAIGGYDERLGPGTPFPGGEDHDYSLRLLEAGHTVHYLPSAVVRHRAWRDQSEYLRLRWDYGLAHGAFYARSFDPADRHILHRVAVDVRRRIRLIPHALVTEPRVGVGHLVFLLASLVGAVQWRRRHGGASWSPALFARPTVPRVPPSVERPRWSVMIPTHNCAQYLGTTIDSVLRQHDGDMQVEVVDDHSTRDDPEAVTSEHGHGLVDFHRHHENRGNIATFNTCLARSRGRYVHILHGDDCVFPGFYERLGAALDAHPECVAAIAGHVLIDEDDGVMQMMPALADRPGPLPDFCERLLGGNLIQAPSIVVRRDAYEAVGGFDARIGTYAEDWEMWTRLAALGPVWYDPELLAGYRVRKGSISSSVGVRSLEDMQRVIRINRETVEGVLPTPIVDRRTGAARTWAAERTARRALRSIDRGHTRDGFAQLRIAFASRPSPTLFRYVAFAPYRLMMRELNRGMGSTTGGQGNEARA